MNLRDATRRAATISVALTMLMPSFAWAAPAPAPTPSPTVTATAPVFNPSDCPADLIPTNLQGEASARCGWVQVPQRHERPGLRPLALPVDVFTTPTSDPTATPLLYLSGGPGGPGIQEATLLFLRSPLGHSVVRQRAVIAFDQRGTGSAEPALECAALEQDDRTFNPRLSVQMLVDDARSCHDTLQREGLDPAAFNTSETVRDVDDIRRALGYTQVDLLGASYGTTVALVTLRTFPDDVRATILDGVVPLQSDVFASSAMSASRQQALANFIADCAADAACADAYPHLADTFAQLAAGADDTVSVDFAGPDGAMHTADISQPTIADILEYLIDDPMVNALIPEAATAALAGDGGPLGPILSRYEVRRAANQRLRFVDYDAVACSDFASGTPIGGRQVCDALGVPYASEMSAPVTTTRPVLLLSGAYDARTPPTLADTASQTLPNSYREVFPATGHGIYQFPQAAACAAVVVSSFLQNPRVQPDDQCVSQVQRPQWAVPEVSG